MGALSGVGVAHLELTDGVAKKVKAYVSLLGSQRMGGSRFVRTQPETHAFEPCCR